LLLDAAEGGDLPAVKLLVQQGAPVNQRSSVKFGWTPLIASIYHYQTNVAVYLIESRADINMADASGETPLMWAIGWGDKALPFVDYLLNHGANINARDKAGATVYSYAQSEPPKPGIIRLIEQHAPTNSIHVGGAQ
jgi:serine/threonine-protein phosphatase 6 regulatory ankyrin repeat subunit B